MEVLFEPFKSRPLSDFHSELRFEFPDIPSQVFDYYLVRTAITMASRGNLIRRVAIIDATHGVTRYRLTPPDNSIINGILDIRSVPDCSCNQRSVQRHFVAPQGAVACCREVAWYDDQEGVLHIRPASCSGTYYVTMSVVPDRSACELPERFYNEFLPTLLMGTRGSMLLIANKPWTNFQLGQAYTNEFLRQIPALGLEVSTHRMRGAVRMQHGRVL